MKCTYELEKGMYIYRSSDGSRFIGGIAYSLEDVHRILTDQFGSSGYTLTRA